MATKATGFIGLVAKDWSICCMKKDSVESNVQRQSHGVEASELYWIENNNN